MPARQNSRGLDLNRSAGADRAARRARRGDAPALACRPDHRRGRAAGRRRSRSSTRAIAGARSAPSSRPGRSRSTGRSPAPRRRSGLGPRARPANAPPSSNARPICSKAIGAELMARIIREGGRTIPAALAELREAVDYLRYYALRARADFATPERAARPDRRAQRNGVARARRLCLHLAVEFPAGDLYRPDRRRARRRQRGHRQARRADAADRRRRGAAAARGRHPGRRAASAARAPARRSARRWSPIPGSPASPLPARPKPRG